MGRLLTGSGTNALGIINGTFKGTRRASGTGVTRTARFSMHVESDHLDEGDLDILLTAGVPQVFEQFVPGMWVVGTDPSHDYTVLKNYLDVPAQMWRVDVELSNDLSLIHI